MDSHSNPRETTVTEEPSREDPNHHMRQNVPYHNIGSLLFTACLEYLDLDDLFFSIFERGTFFVDSEE